MEHHQIKSQLWRTRRGGGAEEKDQALVLATRFSPSFKGKDHEQVAMRNH
jgi:hypothetical protein